MTINGKNNKSNMNNSETVKTNKDFTRNVAITLHLLSCLGYVMLVAYAQQN